MSETPLTQNKIINNDSGITQMNAYSPNLPPSSVKQENNQADSIQKILSSSIQRAKQKITLLEGKQKEERQESKDRASSKQANNNAIAAAMKVLQSRVYELEQNIENHQRERSIMMKQLDNVGNEKKIILNNLEESNRKITVLEHTQKNNKAEIKDLSKQLEEAQNQKQELESKCQQFEMTIKHLEADKQHMSNQFARKEQQIMKSSQGQKNQSKSPELQDKERILGEKERKLHERERRLMEYQSSLKERQNKFTSEKTKIKEIYHENQNLKRQVHNLQRSLNKQPPKTPLQHENYQTYLKQIKDMQEELHMLRETTKGLDIEKQSHREGQQIEMLREDLNLFQSKYDELLRMFKRNEQKAKREEKEIKYQKERVRELEDLLNELSEKIAKLPNCTKELKYLNVKIGKVLNAGIEKYTSLKTPTKSRSNSINRSLSRSTSQRKTTQTSQLNNSRHSNKGSGGSASKSKKKETSGSKSKRVVVSQAVCQTADKEIAELKKEYKRLVKQLNETEDQQTRNRLNQIAFAIQEKNERSTKMKQHNRLK